MKKSNKIKSRMKTYFLRLRKQIIGLSVTLSLLLYVLISGGWGWWWLGGVAVGAAVGGVCVGTAGFGLPVAMMLTSSLATSCGGEALYGDSIFDEVLNSAQNPVGGSLIFQMPDTALNNLNFDTLNGLPTAIQTNMNKGLTDLCNSLRWARMINESCKRYYGAKLINNSSAMLLQANYVHDFLLKQELTSTAASSEIRQFSNDIRPFVPQSDTSMTSESDYLIFRNDVAVNGLPPCVDDLMDDLHITTDHKNQIKNHIVSTTPAEISQFFSQYDSAGIYVPDLLVESMNQWDAVHIRNAIPQEILAAGASNGKLNLKVAVEAFFFPGDTMRVYLRNSSSPYGIVDSSRGKTDFNNNALITFTRAVNGVQYYLDVNHRNTVEIWSSNPVSFSANQLTYNFTSSASKAYGNNQVQIGSNPVLFAMYSGDVTKDGCVDISDVIRVFNDASGFNFGYIPTDVTGDQSVDLTDLVYTYNNSSNFICRIIP